MSSAAQGDALGEVPATAAPSPAASSTPLYVGTCAFGAAEEPHTILKLSLSHADGTLSTSGEPTHTTGANPGWVLIPDRAGAGGTTAFVSMEDAPGSAQAFEIDAKDPSIFTPKGEPVSTSGCHTCHLAIDNSRRWLFASNYSSGSVTVVPIDYDGSLSPATDTKAHSEVTDPALADRQESAHCHQCVPNPEFDEWVAVCDLGLSAVFIYELDVSRGALIGALDNPRHLRMPAGAGCRHAVWSADGTTLFVNNELDCTVTAAAFDGSTGTLTEIQTISALPEGVSGTRAPHRGNSDIHVHPNGRFLYAGVRSPEPGLIAIFSLAEDGA
jgi:6-phosphogluconolactonase (cycloisomerase 2 family)